MILMNLFLRVILSARQTACAEILLHGINCRL